MYVCVSECAYVRVCVFGALYGYVFGKRKWPDSCRYIYLSIYIMCVYVSTMCVSLCVCVCHTLTYAGEQPL